MNSQLEKPVWNKILYYQLYEHKARHSHSNKSKVIKEFRFDLRDPCIIAAYESNFRKCIQSHEIFTFSDCHVALCN